MDFSRSSRPSHASDEIGREFYSKTMNMYIYSNFENSGYQETLCISLGSSDAVISSEISKLNPRSKRSADRLNGWPLCQPTSQSAIGILSVHLC